MRYKGQAFELTVPATGTRLDETALDALIAGFHAIHRQRFSYANPGSPVEIVSLRVHAIGRLPKAQGKLVPLPARQACRGIAGCGWAAPGKKRPCGAGHASAPTRGSLAPP
jgi:N-methylhydantoinase A/oxoprolinase/acetone carboxylase beta subunit